MGTKKLQQKIEWRDENGKFHREDGPAYISEYGTIYWFINGKKHRLDGPAVEYEGGSKEWFVNDERHREDGPAVVYKNGLEAWYLNDVRYDEVSYQKEIIKIKLNRLIKND